MKEPISPERAATAAKIIANPNSYKICEGCDSIVGTSVIMCPNCHAYRFDNNPTRVIQQAKILGNREQRSVTSGDMS